MFTFVIGAEDKENSVKLWNIEDGRVLGSFEKLGENVDLVKFIADDTLILMEFNANFTAVKHSGEIVYKIKFDPYSLGFGGAGRKFIIFFKDCKAFVYDSFTGKKINSVTPKSEMEFTSETHGLIACKGTSI